MALVKHYSPFNPTVPAGTTQDAPYVVEWDEGDVWLYGIQLQIPPGNSGLAGIGFAVAGTPVVPWGVDQGYITGDDNYFEYDVGVEVGNGLTVIMYNADIWDHNFQVRFVNNPISLVTVPPVPPIVAVA